MARYWEDSKLGKGWVIGLGSSAGGLEALTSFVSHLPENFQATVIIAQHLAPHAKSMMVELLGRHTSLPIVAAVDGQRLEAGKIFIVPPNFDVDVTKDEIHLTIAGSETRPKPSVDDFFNSLARTFGAKAVGIILSGTGSDGSEGVRAIRSAGGITLAQDTGSAKYDGMPRSAVETGSVDSILPPETLAKNLLQILHDHAARNHKDSFDSADLTNILAFVKEKQGTDFSQYKMSTIQRRLARRLLQIGIGSLQEYYIFLKKRPGEVAQLSQELLVSVTSFFRDKDVFDRLQPMLFEIFEQKDSGEEIRIWIAGCATGEEPYSVAMLLADIQEKASKSVQIKVFASDLDHDAIVEARSGIYSDDEVQSVPERFRQRFFETRGNNRWEVTKRIRDMVVFARQDMIQNPPFVKLDMISCRNVLIYFETELQTRVLETFHYALLPEGKLLLGTSESLGDAARLYEPIDRKNKFYKKLDVPSSLSNTHIPRFVSHKQTPAQRKLEQANAIVEKGYGRLLESYGICGVVVDLEGNIIQILGDVSKYLGFFSTQADFRLANLLPRDIGMEIPILIKKAANKSGVHKTRQHMGVRELKGHGVQITVRPLYESEEEAPSRPLFLVGFESKKQKSVSSAKILADHDIPMRMVELEQELLVTRDHLQTVIEELGVSNEELQSLNEELSSTNEELQASNEELETTNEELQSSNEELTTVNEELAVKSSELRLAITNLENVQGSIGSPLLVLDQQMRVLRFNKDSLKVFDIANTDIGRDITTVSARLELPEFEEKIRLAIESGIVSEVLCESGNAIYQMRVHPSYDDQRKIVGAILVFFNNTDLMNIQEELGVSETRIRAIIDGSTNLISLKDQAGCYLLVNDMFCRFYGIKRENIIGRSDREIFSENVARQMRDSDLEVLVKREPVKKEEVLIDMSGVVSTSLVSRFPLFKTAEGEPYGVGFIAVDVTAQMNMQVALRESESRYRSIVEDQAVFVSRHRPDGILVFANSIFSQTFGISEDDVPEHSFFECVLPLDRARVREEIKLITPIHPIAQYEHRFERNNGTIRWIRWIHRGVFNSAGEATEYQAVGFDVTDYRNQTDELIEKEAIFEGIFSNTSDLITVYRVVNGEILFESLNRTAEKEFGTSYKQLVGRKLEEFISPEHLKSTLDRYQRVIAEKSPEVFDENLGLTGKYKEYSTTIVPIPGADGSIERVAALSRDISSYKYIERDLRQAKDSAEVANRAKSDFLASMSHELRTPLNVVLGMSHLLSETQLDGEQTSFVSSINRSGRVLLSLIEDVLDISKIESGKVKLESKAFKISDVAKEVGELFIIQAHEKGLHLAIEIEPAANQFVVGDQSRVRQILVNLVGNAVKFTDTGKVSVSLFTDGPEKGGDQIFKFTISDTGIGIEEKDHAKIFQKFSQVDSGHSRRFGGSGLGLVISRRLAHLMNGEMGFSSDYGHGSSFWFTVRLPLTSDQEILARKTRSLIADVPQQAQRPLKILAVDDNPESQNVIRLFLRRLGHDAKVASSGADAIELVEKNYFDIVLMDVQMPVMDGLEATRRIRASKKDFAKIPILALTANVMAGDADRCIEAGMNDYLSKPVKMDALKEMLKKWSSESPMMSSTQTKPQLPPSSSAGETWPT